MPHQGFSSPAHGDSLYQHSEVGAGILVLQTWRQKLQEMEALAHGCVEASLSPSDSAPARCPAAAPNT